MQKLELPGIYSLGKPLESDPELVGKGLIGVNNDKVQEIGNKIDQAVQNNELGSMAKISTGTDSKGNQERKIICVYNDDYHDEAEIFRIRKKLKELGITQPLCYKLDIATHQRKYGHQSHHFCHRT